MISLRNVSLLAPIINYEQRSLKKNIIKNFELKNKVLLKDISLEIMKGEKIAIIGKNGSGKSTLLKLIGGVYKPTKGKLLMKEDNISLISELSAGISENLTGLARMVRSSVIPALENIALWHERDISHSSVERNIGPDANITTDFALVRLTNILDNMIVYPKKMIENLNITKGLIFSQEVMLELTKSGLSREKSYRMVQLYAKKCFAENLNLFDVISNDKFIMSKITTKRLKSIFSYAKHFKNVNLIFRRVFK